MTNARIHADGIVTASGKFTDIYVHRASGYEIRRRDHVTPMLQIADLVPQVMGKRIVAAPKHEGQITEADFLAAIDAAIRDGGDTDMAAATATYHSTDTDGMPCECVLSASFSASGWRVEDSCGSVWWPSDDAADEIEAAPDPAAAALAMCRDYPSRGTWNA